VHAGSPREHIYVVPFSVPGDVVRARAWEHHPDESHSHADFVEVAAPSPLRDDSRVRCKYFASCSGCQFQMLDYPEQLRAKRTVVERAFARFSKLDKARVPEVGDTIGSPLQYGYRTKLTPHFNGPPGHPGPRRDGREPPFASCPDIGFMIKGRRKIMDIEDCAIGTDAVRVGLARERARMQVEYANYKRGATVLLRENTARHAPPETAPPPESDPAGAVRVAGPAHVDVKTVITNHNAVATEYIKDHVFSNTAGSFFQNNNAIMPVFTDFVRTHVLPPPPSSSESPSRPPIKYLIDAYSGAGLFTITLSSLFQSSTGIDIDPSSIANATRNAAANGIPPAQATFIAADATTRLFASVTYPADETVVVLDPPRRGCDADFLAQLARFGPRRVVYVSCNVHTQARDVGILVRGQHDDGGKGGGSKYELESVRGFDFFPQTHHVEGVAVLNRVDEVEKKGEDEGKGSQEEAVDGKDDVDMASS
jgi:tRNA (uracil-5-)-methyltransferase